MTAPRPTAAILAERLTVVLAMGEANGAHQRAQAGLSGARIEVSAREGQPPADGRTAGLDAAQARLTAAAERIAGLDVRLAELDRELAAAGG